MDYTTARDELEIMLQISVDPVLTDVDVDLLMQRARRADAAGNSSLNVSTAATWVASTAYVYGDVIAAAGRWWMCCVAGTSGTTTPSWPDITGEPPGVSRVHDNDVRWVDNGGPWAETYDLRAAAYQGWRLKASKASGRFDFVTDGQDFKRSMTYAQCMEMAASFKPRRLFSAEAR